MNAPCSAQPAAPAVQSGSKLALATALFLILIGARLLLIGHAGAATPFMDEWDGDWNELLAPWLNGLLRPADIVSPFVQHRIAFTRLTVLSIFTISGYWDVALQMILNALIGAATVVAAAFAFSRVLSGGFALAAILAACLVQVVPFASDSVLLGFNTHFYLLSAFSLVGLWLTSGARTGSPRWLIGALCAGASFFCLASGALTLAAAAATQGLQIACGRRRGVREGLGALALASGAILMAGFIPAPPADAGAARSLGEFATALARLAGWPAGWIGTPLLLPSILFALRTLKDRADPNDPRWFNLAALVWVGGQIVALAFGRGQSPLQCRYQDILMVGLTLHFVSALWCAERARFGGGAAKAGTWALASWIALALATLPHAERHLFKDIAARREATQAGGDAIRGYLITGDPARLSIQRTGVAVYPDPVKLRAFLDAPRARSALPPDLTLRAPPHRRLEAAKQAFLRFGAGWVALGLILLAATLGAPGLRRVAGQAPVAARDAAPG